MSINKRRPSQRRSHTPPSQERFGVAREYLKAYVHYHPSYYHLHVHFSHTQLGSLGNGAGKAHLLGEIIQNIEDFCPAFYQKASLEVEVGKGTPLGKCFGIDES